MFGLLHNVIAPTSLDAVLASNVVLVRACMAVGGRMYPVGSIPFSPDDWRRHYGDRWDALPAARRRHDPAVMSRRV